MMKNIDHVNNIGVNRNELRLQRQNKITEHKRIDLLLWFIGKHLANSDLSNSSRDIRIE